ncbi:MAG: TIGR00730 family Rossman fold protein [Alphaproteobacteria bacterium]|nr:TIGR00730 family Rossman fold protein [Alphaproteobacteria bacterium]
MGKNLCVYCGASEKADDIYRQAAINLGSLIGVNNHGLVYGGGRLGLMGLVANAVLDNGGKVFGFTTRLLDEREGAHPNLTELHIVDSMHTRKLKMSELADAFVILPGGFGTLDELFEIITWRQLNIHKKPIIILNINGYWGPLVNLMQQIIKEHFAHPEHIDYITVLEKPEQVFDVLK